MSPRSDMGVYGWFLVFGAVVFALMGAAAVAEAVREGRR